MKGPRWLDRQATVAQAIPVAPLQIDKLEVFEQRHPSIRVTGFYPVSAVYQLFFGVAIRSFPEFTNRLFAYLLRQLLQQWIDDYHSSLPF